MDAAIYLVNRHFLGQPTWSSMITPELSYQYTPYNDQQNFPIFDTVSLPLTYDTLYSSDTFLGPDRLQNANRFNFGAKATFSNSTTGFNG